MQRITGALLSIMVAATPSIAQTQPDRDPPRVESTRLVGSLHRLTCLGTVHAVASIGPDGVLLVDTCYRRTADDLRTALSEIGGRDIRYILNTHSHNDHVGGNAALGSSATIVAHRSVRQRMGHYFSLPPGSERGLPNVLMTDELELLFNGERIHLFHVGRDAHTDGDVVVHFVDSGVACIGDLVFADSFPGADPARGGDVDGLETVIEELTSKLPEDVRIIPSHGREYTVDDLHRYHRMMVETTAAVRRAAASGRDAEAIDSGGVLAPWLDTWGDGLQPAAGWITSIVTLDAGGPRPSICEPLTRSLVDDGIEAAVTRYHRLESSSPEAYDFGENQLNTLGYELLGRSMVSEAIEIFKLNVQTYPEAFNTYDSLGEAYLAAGDTRLAVQNYERSLELNPDNTNAADVLAGIRSAGRETATVTD